jgi:hypothetical protein
MPQPRELLTRAADEALTLRGAVTLAVPASEHKWCAVRTSVQGHVELRVGEPGGGPLRLLGRRWLARHGFTRVGCAWARPLAPGTAAPDAVAILAGALRHALHVRRGEELFLSRVQPGAPGGVVPPVPDACHSEHVAAALKWLMRARRGNASIEIGRPALPVARAYVNGGGTLALAAHPPGEPERETEVGHFELTTDGVREASERLCARLRDYGCAPGDPLFIGLVGVTDPVKVGG